MHIKPQSRCRKIEIPVGIQKEHNRLRLQAGLVSPGRLCSEPIYSKLYDQEEAIFAESRDIIALNHRYEDT